jgi:Flp pilus assembly protein TadD
MRNYTARVEGSVKACAISGVLMGSRSRSIIVAIAALLLVVLAAACKGKPEATSDEELMKSGLDALYARNDPASAAADFRKILEHNPTHYGATFQLASALDREGKKDEANPLWEKVLSMAVGYNDAATAAKVRERIGNGENPETLMKAGLDLFYAKNHPLAAAERFRRVLELNPNHYGATYQLAAALDAAGKSDEARPLWQKMLQMAEAIQDVKTADKARERIAAQGS